jgi:hypothetical protein
MRLLTPTMSRVYHNLRLATRLSSSTVSVGPLQRSCFSPSIADPRTVAALHAPTGQMWWPDVGEVFQGAAADRSPKYASWPPASYALLTVLVVRPISFFEDLAANASAHNVAIAIYSGNDDTQDSHWGSQGRQRHFVAVLGADGAC